MTQLRFKLPCNLRHCEHWIDVRIIYLTKVQSTGNTLMRNSHYLDTEWWDGGWTCTRSFGLLFGSEFWWSDKPITFYCQLNYINGWFIAMKMENEEDRTELNMIFAFDVGVIHQNRKERTSAIAITFRFHTENLNTTETWKFKYDLRLARRRKHFQQSQFNSNEILGYVLNESNNEHRQSNGMGCNGNVNKLNLN